MPDPLDLAALRQQARDAHRTLGLLDGAEFIAQAVVDIPALCDAVLDLADEVERQQATIDAQREAMIANGALYASQAAELARLRIVAKLDPQTIERFAALMEEGVSRDPQCVEQWPECWDGGYDPRCCRFPKSCSCAVVPSDPSAFPVEEL